MERKLTAILSADVKGYRRLMGEDEIATVRTLTAYREVMTALIHAHRGRVVDSPGDNMLVEFASVVDAVQCATAIQQELTDRNAELPPHRQMAFRIGINVGDVLTENGRLYGDGVNIAARLEGLADAGGICISEAAYSQVKNKLALGYEYIGEQPVKNIAEPVRAYKVQLTPGAAAPGVSEKTKAAEPAAQPGRSDTAPSYGRKAILVLGGLLLILGVVVTVQHLSFRPSTSSAAIPSMQTLPLSLPDKPSIVVLPFTNMSDDPSQDYFSDGMTEDITTDLSKISGLFIISRNSAFTYKGKAVKAQDVSREMGVRYILEGSIRKAGDQLRITAQLIDGTTGGHVWSERYDRLLRDIFALQDEITQRIVAALQVEIGEAELVRVRRIPTESLTAYDLYLRGLELWFRANYETKKEANAQARQLFEQAVALDPHYAQAYAGLSLTYFTDSFLQWSSEPAQALERALELAQKAIALDDSLPSSHTTLGVIYMWKKQYEQAIAEGERAISFDPNFAEGFVNLGWILIAVGRPEEAVGVIEKAMRLNPRSSARYLQDLGMAYREVGRCEEAITVTKQFLAVIPNNGPAHYTLAICYAEFGRLEEAQAAVAELVRLQPSISLESVRQNLPAKDPARLECHLASLRKAGLK